MERSPISVCIVSSAEAHRIPRCLESVSEWVSEIIVVLNQEVADGTEQIALEFGARVFREPWRGFIQQKNSAASKCSQPWLLNLDADEVVSTVLRDEIIAAVTRQDANLAAYQFPRCTFYCGRWIRHGDWYPDRVLRLWQRGRAFWSGVDPHASLKVDGAVGTLRSDLLHHSNESINQHVAKIISFGDEFVAQYPAGRRWPGLFSLIIRPFWRFFRAYVIRLGFLDGWPGYYIAWLTAFATLTRYVKIREARPKRSTAP